METRTPLSRERMLALCERALEVKLSLAEFAAAFPGGAPPDAYAARLHEDLHDAVVHVPGRLFGGLDERAWRASEMYASVSLHTALLRSPIPLSALATSYARIRADWPFDLDEIPARIAGARAASSGA